MNMKRNIVHIGGWNIDTDDISAYRCPTTSQIQIIFKSGARITIGISKGSNKDEFAQELEDLADLFPIAE